MAFPRELLHPRETLVLDLRPHWWYITPSAALLALVTVVGLIVVTKDPGDAVNIAVGLVMLAALGNFGIRYSKWVTKNFVLTSDRLIYRSGVIAKSGVEIPLDKVNTVFFEQSIFGRILGFGSLKIESASETGAEFFSAIRKPSRVQNEIYLQMQANESASHREMGEAIADAAGQATAPSAPPPASPPPSAPQLSVHEQLEKLGELHERGVITEAEFQAKKTELLGRM